MKASRENRLDQGSRDARGLVRTQDRDRYFATLFAPEPARAALFVLYAFNVEIARIREVVSDPLPGEVRQQWWRDVLNGATTELSHPLARALMPMIEQYRLPRKALLDLIEARSFDLYDDPMPSWNDLTGYCGETSSALFRLASLILADGSEPGSAEACGHAGVAYALTGLLRALPWHSRRGQVYIPEEVLRPFNLGRPDLTQGRDSPELRSALALVRARARQHLEKAKALIPSVSRAAESAFRPLALIEPYLKQMERAGYRPFETIVDLADWKRIAFLWRWRL